MSKPDIKDPVKKEEIPPITRDVSMRRSKWDDVLEDAEDIKDEEDNTLPLEFDTYNSATSAARRIRERAEKVGREVDVTQRGQEVYITHK